MFDFIFCHRWSQRVATAVRFGVMKLRSVDVTLGLLQYLLQPEQVINFNKFKYYLFL